MELPRLKKDGRIIRRATDQMEIARCTVGDTTKEWPAIKDEKSTAAEIVHRCNQHNALVEALKQVLQISRSTTPEASPAALHKIRGIVAHAVMEADTEWYVRESVERSNL